MPWNPHTYKVHKSSQHCCEGYRGSVTSAGAHAARMEPWGTEEGKRSEDQGPHLKGMTESCNPHSTEQHTRSRSCMLHQFTALRTETEERNRGDSTVNLRAL